MTFLELRVKLKELKHTSAVYLNLFSEYHGTAEKPRIIGLKVIKNNDMWDVYEINERGGEHLWCHFYTEDAVCEYIYCYFKEISDHSRWL